MNQRELLSLMELITIVGLLFIGHASKHNNMAVHTDTLRDSKCTFAT